MKQILNLLLLLSVFGVALSREKPSMFADKKKPSTPTESGVNRKQEKVGGRNLFEEELSRACYKSQTMQQLLQAYKQLVVSAQKNEIDEGLVDRFLTAIESTFRGRDLTARAMLLGLQEVLSDALQAPIFEARYPRLRQLLDKLSYDLQPFAIRSGDYVVLEVPKRKLFCAAEQRADGVHIIASQPVPGNQVQVDCLFKITTSVPGAVVKFGDTVQLEPLYLRYGPYVLPPLTKLGITYEGTGHGAGDTATLLLREGGTSAITLVSLQKEVLTGSPVVVDKGFHLVDAESGTQWALRGEQLVAQVGDATQGRSGSFFSLRNIKPEIIDRVHKKIIQKNLDSVLKEPAFEARVLGVTQVLSSMRRGFDFDQQEQLRKVLEVLYNEHAKASTNGLRLLEKLFIIALSHPELADSKLMFEQFSSHVVDALNSRSIMYGDIISFVRPDRQEAVQVSLDEALTKQGHLIPLAVKMGKASGMKLQGHECAMLTSPRRKQGSVSYGDEVIATSFFVEDGRDGGLLACPVIWWVNSIDSKKDATHRVMASPIKAEQAHNGQEVFVIKPPVKGLKGSLVTGDMVQLYGKQACEVLTFGPLPNDALLEVRRVDRSQLADLADKRFKQYVERAESENSLTKKLSLLESALDIFKGQRLLSVKASKILYAEIKRVADDAKAVPAQAMPALRKLLAKAQDAPFSPAAKKRFISWNSKLPGSVK